MKLFIQAAAEDDILRQVEWYAEQGLIEVARRFAAAAASAIERVAKMPFAGMPKHTGNPSLAGLRMWHVLGFAEFRIYYIVQPDLLTVVRVLHGKRDIGEILETQAIERPAQGDATEMA